VPAASARRGARPGFTLVELLFTLALATLVAGLAVPQALASLGALRGRAAARYLAGRMALARTQAVARGSAVALRFVEDTEGVSFSSFEDGNRNGVRVRDIDLLLDPLIQPPVRLEDLFPGTAIALTPGTPAAAAIMLGGTDLLSFSPTGSSTSGTIHVRGPDGMQWAVRVLGVTGRVRVLKYAPAAGEWIDTW
jgi:prepilin-type N-terminal cleavage/methylation domain-containing protein